MALGCKVNDAVNIFVLHQLIECVKVANVHLHELVVWLILDVFEVGKVTCISQLVKVYDLYFGYLFTKSLTTCEPIKPAPPVITIERLYCVITYS